MTDDEIKQYLDDNHWCINAQDGIMDILNTSDQIISAKYDHLTGTMTLVTRNNAFTFKWKLKKY